MIGRIDLSIIVPCYNMGNHLHRCIDSILSQIIDNTKYEIVLINDAVSYDSFMNLKIRVNELIPDTR